MTETSTPEPRVPDAEELAPEGGDERTPPSPEADTGEEEEVPRQQSPGGSDLKVVSESRVLQRSRTDR